MGGARVGINEPNVDQVGNHTPILCREQNLDRIDL